MSYLVNQGRFWKVMERGTGTMTFVSVQRLSLFGSQGTYYLPTLTSSRYRSVLRRRLRVYVYLGRDSRNVRKATPSTDKVF